MYEIAEDVVSSSAVPHMAVVSIFNKVLELLYRHRTLKDIIGYAIENPTEAMKMATMIITGASINLYGPAYRIASALQSLEDVAYAMLLSVYTLMYRLSFNRDKDLLLNTLRSIIEEKYSREFIDEVAKKCTYLDDSEMAKCIYDMLKS